VSEKWSQGFAHAFAGMVMLVPGFFLILLVGWILDQLFIEEADADAVAGAGGGVVEAKPAAAAAGGGASELVIEIPRRRPQPGTGDGGASKGGA
jgi:hypothetical protein